MSNKETDPIDSMIPIRDGRGNFLAIGAEVVFTGVSKMNNLIGKIVTFKPGDISLIESGENKAGRQTPAEIGVVFHFTLAVPPQSPIIGDLFRIINPDSEVLISKILDPNKPSV